MKMSDSFFCKVGSRGEGVVDLSPGSATVSSVIKYLVVLRGFVKRSVAQEPVLDTWP